MNVGGIWGAHAFLQSSAAKRQQTAADQSTAVSAAPRRRDRVDLRYDEIEKAEKQGFIEVNGNRYAVSDEMVSDMKQAYERLQVRNEGIETRLNAERRSREERQQNETAMKKGKSMGRAMEIARRISEGGRVPAEDEHFLMAFSQEMYQAAKMTADMSEEQKDFDSVFDPGELAVMDAQRILDGMEKDEEEPSAV